MFFSTEGVTYVTANGTPFVYVWTGLITILQEDATKLC